MIRVEDLLNMFKLNKTELIDSVELWIWTDTPVENWEYLDLIDVEKIESDKAIDDALKNFNKKDFLDSKVLNWFVKKYKDDHILIIDI